MGTSIVAEHLSDGSIAYNVEIIDGSQKVVIAAVDEDGATAIALILKSYASYADIRQHEHA